MHCTAEDVLLLLAALGRRQAFLPQPPRMVADLLAALLDSMVRTLSTSCPKGDLLPFSSSLLQPQLLAGADLLAALLDIMALLLLHRHLQSTIAIGGSAADLQHIHASFTAAAL